MMRYISFCLAFLFVSFAGNAVSQEEDLSVSEVIKRARQVLAEGYYLMEDYACSTRTSTFMKQELLDVIQRYDMNNYAFTPVDDWAEGAVFWKKPDSFKYRVGKYYRSQTWGDTIFAPVKMMASSLNGPFLFEKFDLVSPLSDSCFTYYDFQLLSTITIDYIKKCFEIAVIPKKNDLSLVSGIIRIEDRNFSVTDMKISFRKKTKIGIPVDYTCEIKFLQWQERYNLCYQILIGAELVLPKLSRINMVQQVEFWDFAVNSGLPDTLFDKRKLDYRGAESHLSDNPFSLTSLSRQMERQASEDYKYSGTFAVWTSLWDVVTLNRVEGIKTSVGIKTEGRFSKYWRLGIRIGYGWSNRYTSTRIDFGHFRTRGTGISYGAACYDAITPIDPTVIPTFANSFSFLIGSNDYLDYLTRKGGNLFVQYNWNDSFHLGLQISRERHASANALSKSKYRTNPEVEEGRFTTFEIYSLWDSRPDYLPVSRWSLTGQILFSTPQLNDSNRGFYRLYCWLRRYQVLPFRLAFEADVSAGIGMGHLPLQYTFVSIHDRYRFEKDVKYHNWYGEGGLAFGVSVFFGEQLFEKLFLAMKLRVLTLYRLRFMVFADGIRFLDNLPEVISPETMFNGPWTTDMGLGLEGLNGMIRIEFSNRYIGLRIRPDFIPDIFK